jgi:hypothetical protein
MIPAPEKKEADVNNSNLPDNSQITTVDNPVNKRRKHIKIIV